MNEKDWRRKKRKNASRHNYCLSHYTCTRNNDSCTNPSGDPFLRSRDTRRRIHSHSRLIHERVYPSLFSFPPQVGANGRESFANCAKKNAEMFEKRWTRYITIVITYYPRMLRARGKSKRMFYHDVALRGILGASRNCKLIPFAVRSERFRVPCFALITSEAVQVHGNVTREGYCYFSRSLRLSPSLLTCLCPLPSFDETRLKDRS